MSKGKEAKIHMENCQLMKSLKSSLHRYNSRKQDQEFETSPGKKKEKRGDSLSWLNITPSKVYDICTTDSDTVFTLPSYFPAKPNPGSKTTAKIRKPSDSNCCQKLDDCQKEIRRVRVKLLKMKEGAYFDEFDGDYLVNAEETRCKPKKKKRQTEKSIRLKQKQVKEDAKKEVMKELEVSEKLERNTKEIEEFYLNEIEDMKLEQEAKIKAKVSQMKAEFDRNLNRMHEENLALKKQNEVLKTQLEDALARNEIKKGLKSEKGSSEKELMDLKDRYIELQSDYMKIRKNNGDVLCSKCKGCTKHDQDLIGKIENLKNFINKFNT